MDIAVDHAISNSNYSRNYIGGRYLGALAFSQVRGVGILGGAVVTAGSMIRTSQSLRGNTNLGNLVNRASGLSR